MLLAILGSKEPTAVPLFMSACDVRMEWGFRPAIWVYQAIKLRWDSLKAPIHLRHAALLRM